MGRRERSEGSDCLSISGLGFGLMVGRTSPSYPSLSCAGKGTQCAKLVDDYKFVHLSGKFNLVLLD
jgi:hypothetical protein